MQEGGRRGKIYNCYGLTCKSLESYIQKCFSCGHWTVSYVKGLRCASTVVRKWPDWMEKNLEALGSSWKYLEVHVNTWKYLEALGSTWKHLEVLGSTWRHLEVPGSTWKYLEATPAWMEAAQASRRVNSYARCHSL